MAIITNLQPPAGQAIASDTALSFDVIDPVVSELRVFVWVVFKATGTSELVYDADNFAALYSFSQITAIAGGRRFTVRRVGGWPSTPEIRVDTCACPPDLASSSGEANTASNVGGGAEVFQTKSGVDLRFRTLTSTDSSVAITQNASSINLAAEVTTASNLGAGDGVFASKVGADLRFKSLTASGVLTLTPSADEIALSSSAEANTASNLGAGAGVFESKSGADLRFKSLTTDGTITITPSATEIQLSAVTPATESLSATLAVGNTTGGTNLIVSDGDAILPATTGVPSIGSASLRFAELYSQVGLFAGAIETDGPADGDDLIIGDGTADNHGITLFTGAANTGGVYFTDTAGAWQGAVYYPHGANALYFATAGAARALLNAGGFSPNTNNLYDLGVSTFAWRSLYLTNTAFAPNVRTQDATGSAASAAITVKPGLGGPTSGAGGSMTVEGGDAGGGTAAGGGLFLRGGNPSGSGTPGRVLITAADAVSGNTRGADVDIAAGAGSGTQQGGDINILAGDNVGTGSGGGLVIKGGGCSSGTGGLVQILGGNAGVGGTGGNVLIAGNGGSSTTTTPGVVSVSGGNAFTGSNFQGGFGQLIGGAGDGTGQGGHAQIQGGNGGASGNSGDVRLRSGSGLVNGRVTVEDMGVEFNELASMPGPAITAGNGRLWARDDAATALIFTDDTGADRPISKMQPVTFVPMTANLPAGGAASLAPETAGGQPALNYSASSTNTATWVFTLPTTYNGGNLDFVIWYTGTTSSTNTIRWSVRVEKYTVGESMNSSHFAASVTCDAPGPATAEDLVSATFTLTNANIDGAVAGDVVRFEIQRLGGDGADTYAGVSEFIAAQLLEP